MNINLKLTGDKVSAIKDGVIAIVALSIGNDENVTIAEITVVG